jgi:hypothetical protein
MSGLATIRPELRRVPPLDACIRLKAIVEKLDDSRMVSGDSL